MVMNVGTDKALFDRVHRARAEDGAVGVRLCMVGCGSLACPVCGPVAGLRLRDRLIARYKEAGVSQVGLVTLTISDQVLWMDASEQYESIRDRRLISEFIRFLRSVTGADGGYFRICEFGGKSNRLHYHLIVDNMGRLGREQLQRLQSWCQERLGTMDYKFRPVGVGVKYVCKYVTKGSTDTLPDFVLDANGFKFYSTSRGFWLGEVNLKRERKQPTESRHQRPLRVRLTRCGDGTVGLSEVISEDGELVRRFAFALPIPFGCVMRILEQMPQDCVERVGSDWPVGVSRWVDVDVECLGELLETAAWAWGGGRVPRSGTPAPAH